MGIKPGLLNNFLLTFLVLTSCTQADVFSTRNKLTSLAPSEGVVIVGHSNLLDCVRESIHSEHAEIPIFIEDEICKNLPPEMNDNELEWLQDPRFLKLMSKHNVKYMIHILGKNEFHEERGGIPIFYGFDYPIFGEFYKQFKSTNISATIWELSDEPISKTDSLSGTIKSSAHDEGELMHMMFLPHYVPPVTEGPACKALGKNIAKFLKSEGHADEELMSDLYLAASQGREDKVKKFLTKGVDVDHQRKYNETALYIASSKGYKSIVNTLLTHGADVNHQTEFGITALMAASEVGHEEVVRLLLTNGADINIQSKYGETALDLSASGGHESIVRILLSHGADINHQTTYGWSALMTASEKGYESIVKMLIANGADVNIQSKYDETALYVASSKGHKAIVTVLLNQGAKIDQPTTFSWTPLMVASENGQDQVVRTLLENGAEVNFQVPDSWLAAGGGASALTEASKYGNEAVVKILLAHGADINHRGPDGWTALMFASKAGYEGVARVLLENGANVNHSSDNGLTALQVAETQEMIQLLKAAGAK